MDRRPATYHHTQQQQYSHEDAFCFYCMKHKSKLTAEKNKEPAYISVGFKNWKKTPDCFKDHQNSKCHSGASTFEIIFLPVGIPQLW